MAAARGFFARAWLTAALAVLAATPAAAAASIRSPPSWPAAPIASSLIARPPDFADAAP